MPERVKSGYPKRGADIFTLEFRVQACQMQVEMLSRRLARLHGAILTYLEAGPDEKSAASHLLRYELSKAGQHIGGT